MRVLGDKYKRLRMLTYTIAKPYLKDQDMTAYEFMPLDDDPTPEEIEQHEKERLEKEMANARKRRDEILEKVKKRNGGI